jgi:hypothetical protein
LVSPGALNKTFTAYRRTNDPGTTGPAAEDTVLHRSFRAGLQVASVGAPRDGMTFDVPVTNHVFTYHDVSDLTAEDYVKDDRTEIAYRVVAVEDLAGAGRIWKIYTTRNALP